jgi:hypothetical protein
LRYRKDLIEPGLVDGKGCGEAIICFLNTADSLIVPIRSAIVTATHLHGSTASVDVRLGEFVENRDLTAVQRQLFGGKDYASPTFQEDNVVLKSGFLFFETSSNITIMKSRNVEVWEEIVNTLAKMPQFSSERYFWTVLGLRHEIQEPGETNFFSSLPEGGVKARSNYRLLTYHYHPDLPLPTEPGEPLALLHGDCLELQGPSELCVDSAYDLKEFVVRTTNNSFGTRGSWIRIGPKDHMILDIEISVRGEKWRSLIVALAIAGALFAQSVLAPSEMPSAGKIVLIGLLSTIVGCAAVFGIRRDL